MDMDKAKRTRGMGLSDSTQGYNASADIISLFDKWNASLATLDPHKVADLYHPDAVLLPTVSNRVRITREEIVDYFAHFLKARPQGVIDECNPRMLGPELCANSGIYTFTLHKDGKLQKVQARFTYLYRKFGDQWLIAEHHSSVMPENAGISKLFDKWNAALATLDPREVADLYAPGAVLLPTVSNIMRTNREAITDYFAHFLKYKPFGQIDESSIRVLSPTVAINSGIYTFTLEKNGKRSKVQARFTFVYRKVEGQWMIAEHHSSEMPEKYAPES